jgi:hypothetical protein
MIAMSFNKRPRKRHQVRRLLEICNDRLLLGAQDVETISRSWCGETIKPIGYFLGPVDACKNDLPDVVMPFVRDIN